MNPAAEKRPGWSAKDEIILLAKAWAACDSLIESHRARFEEVSRTIEKLLTNLEPSSDLVFVMDEDQGPEIEELAKLKNEKSKIAMQLQGEYQRIGSIRTRLLELDYAHVEGVSC